MNYELIICEKPSAAMKIANALADGKAVKKSDKGVSYYELSHKKKDIVVASAVGHLFSVAEKNKGKGFTYPVYNIEWKPSSEVNSSSSFSKKYVNMLKKLSKNANEFTVATDYDIEGEVIGLNIIKYICKQKDANRMKYSTLTKDELVNSYEHKQPTLDWGQARAGETRHFLDWIYGINLSRALTGAVKSAGQFKIMSIGRVQGPALKMIVDKEKEIFAFVPVPYWQVEAKLKKNDEDFIAMHKQNKFDNKEDAKLASDNAKKAKEADIKDVSKKDGKQQPPFPFDLGTLQKESYRCFKIKPKDTLAIAQTLYTAGFISYPRTSSQKLPSKLDFKKIFDLLLKQKNYSLLVNDLLGSNKKIPKPNEGKKDDPAHPAIHPTGYSPSGLSDRELKVYDLVVKRFLATFSEPSIRETITASFSLNNEPFIAKGSRTKVDGWHKYYSPYVSLKEEVLPAMNKDEKAVVKKVSLLSKETQPPKRYTQSSIITELEKRKLGTKATRADIVDNLFKRNYVRGSKSIEANALGIKTVEALEKRAPEIVDEKLTSHIEDEMEDIRNNKIEGSAVLEEVKEKLNSTLSKFKAKEKEIGRDLINADRAEQDERSTLGECPRCKEEDREGQLKVLYSPKTKKYFIGCSNYPDCDLVLPLPQKVHITPTEDKCEQCGYPMIEIQGKGKKGPQKLCVNPKCPSKSNGDSSEIAKEKKVCSKCGAPMVLRKSIYGEFWGCSKYPKCKNTEQVKKEQE